MLKIGVLASTKGSDLQAVIDAIAAKKLSAQIACVVSNKADAFALERAKKHGIEAIFLNPKNFKSKEEFDLQLVKELEKRKVELVLLIGYNKILTKIFVDAFRNRAMNIHPSLLPSFKGWDKDVHKEVLDSGVKVTGCTLHFLSEEADSGPIVMQKAVAVAENETVDSLKAKVQKAEQEVIIKAIKLFAEGKIKVEENKVKITDL
ncbi:MAG: phosphoribosylglycinamide formyltransferase [Candidatus ainarchaeum sp.]|nr:phosphoribosylglycinamide formyltransferase [Candidatus ainarchaeum sp.]